MGFIRKTLNQVLTIQKLSFILSIWPLPTTNPPMHAVVSLSSENKEECISMHTCYLSQATVSALVKGLLMG